MNLYNTLTVIKSSLGITATTHDAKLFSYLEAASRMIDKFCNRFFYVWERIEYFDGACPLFIKDLLSIDTSGFDTDEDGDLDYDNTLATTDYILYPSNAFPKTRVELTPNSNYGGFGGSIRTGVRIEGNWGYGDGISATPYRLSGVLVTMVSPTATTGTVSTSGVIEPGHTIRVDTEQIFVAAVSGTSLSAIERNINGTTAVAHTATAASIYEYPKDIELACLTVAEGLFETRGNVFKSERIGDYSYTLNGKALGEAEVAVLMPYKKRLL